MSNNVCPSCGHGVDGKSNVCSWCGSHLFFTDEPDDQLDVATPEEEVQEESEMEIYFGAVKKYFAGDKSLTYDIFTTNGEKLCTIKPGEKKYIPVNKKTLEIYAIPAFASEDMKMELKTPPVTVDVETQWVWMSLIKRSFVFRPEPCLCAYKKTIEK